MRKSVHNFEQKQNIIKTKHNFVKHTFFEQTHQLLKIIIWRNYET